MAIFRREKSRSTMPVLSDIAGEARQSWFGEDDDHGGQQICELNRAHQGAVGVVPGEGSQPTRFHVGRFINLVWMCLLTIFSKAGEDLCRSQGSLSRSSRSSTTADPAGPGW
jgi:hypothetical protein